MEFTMTNRRHPYNNTSHGAMAVTLDSAISDFRPSDTESQIVTKHDSEAATTTTSTTKKKGGIKEKCDATD